MTFSLATIGDAFKVFRAGEEISNPATWKDVQNSSNALIALLSAIALLMRRIGYGDYIPSDSDIAVFGTSLAALINVVLTTITSKKVGIGSKPALQPTESRSDIQTEMDLRGGP